MATLVLQTAGAAVGGLFGPFGAALGRAAGGLAGAVVDAAVLGGGRSSTGPRLDTLVVQGGEEGAPIARVYGRVKVTGTVIWATRLEEETVEEGGGKGGATTRTYRYHANFAVGLCEGPVDRIGRVWADGKPLDLTGLVVRLHKGGPNEAPDPLIAAKQADAPAYRGLAYAVFERLPLEPFGNRIPQLAFEVIRVVDRLEGMVRAVTMIPGSTEFGYATTPVTREEGLGVTASENRHVGTAETNFEAALDELVELCPNLERVSLVVAWFGDDLRVDHCTLKPKVEAWGRETRGATWRVGGLDRDAAERTSRIDGRPAYGGTPSDGSVVEAIRAIKARGLKAVFYPFVLMDVAAGNDLEDPYGGASQPAYPWRGRITVDPAPGRPGSPDKTTAAAAAVAAFVGMAAPGDFSAGGAAVHYSGPTEWTLRRMILHYAHLCDVAGGVDAFLIGSELRGLTWVRSSRTAFPFVEALRDLAGDVKAVVGPATKVSYAADWSEFFGFQPADGSGDVRFHLDRLWASPDVDFVGIDVYWPLADWRDGDHLDAAQAPSTTDLGYLGGNVAGGEGFDWYYAEPGHRRAQIRTPIADGAHGRPWTFRYKDLAGWWDNAHRHRLDGVEDGTTSPWEPRMKPFWLTELGCPAVDRGANQPNVFIDPKSSESMLPHFSDGGRDDAVQRRYLEAIIGHFDPDADGFVAAHNPVAPGGGRMVVPGGIHLWTWDARPWPAFPALTQVWSDGDNWTLGHWLNGRLGGTSLKALVSAICHDFGFAGFDVEGLDRVVDGYLIDRPMAARDAIEPLARAFGFDAFDRGVRLVFADLDRGPSATVTAEDLVDPGEADAPIAWTRGQDAELPNSLRLGHLDSGRDFAAAVAASRRIEGGGRRVSETALAVVAPAETMRRAAESALHDAWTGRDAVRLALPPSWMALDAGDVVRVPDGGGTATVVVEEVEDGGARRVRGRRLERSVLRGAAAAAEPRTTNGPAVYGPPAAVLLDIPAIDEAVPAHRPFLAATARPWPGALAVEIADGGDGYALLATIGRPARMGTLAAPLGPGPEHRLDRGNSVAVRIARALESRPEAAVLGGANLAAVLSVTGIWELLQFCEATLIGPDEYRLAGLLRARFGSEEAMAAGHAAGAAFVLLDGGAVPLPLDRGAVGRPTTLRVTAAGADPSRVGRLMPVTPGGRGLRPLSPVHVTARRLAGGDVTIGWVRRTRAGGDGWAAEVPLGEEAERYRLAILDGAAVVRTIETTAPTATYTAAAQTADFGAPPATLRLKVAQVAPGYGAGTAREVERDV